MSKAKIRQAVSFIKEFLSSRNIGADKIILFGSYVRGEVNEDSDVDIAIISSDFKGKDIFERADMLKDLNWSLVEQFLLPFDIIPISSDEWDSSTSMIVGFAKQGQEILS